MNRLAENDAAALKQALCGEVAASLPAFRPRLLLVDDEPNIVNALRRVFRTEGYRVLTATCARDAFDLLAREEVGVIISDQRMPGMTGVEFLQRVKLLYPKTIRLVLSGYTELETVTQAINEGAIYKFLSKPWEDELLLENIREAFQFYEMERENVRLTDELRRANEALASLNRGLELQVDEKTHECARNVGLLRVAQEILEHLPLAVIGIDTEGMVALSNRAADGLFRSGGLMGETAEHRLPNGLRDLLRDGPMAANAEWNGETVALDGTRKGRVWIYPMGERSRSRGTVLVIAPTEPRA